MPSRRTASLAAALAGAASLLGGPTTAVAGPAVHHADGGAAGARLTGVAELMTTSGGSTGVTCGASWLDLDGTYPSAVGFGFASCTSTVPLQTGAASVAFPPGLTGQVTSDGTLVVHGPVTATVVLNSPFGAVTCVYAAPALYGAVGADESVGFDDQTFTKQSGSATCPTGYRFTARYTPATPG